MYTDHAAMENNFFIVDSATPLKRGVGLTFKDQNVVEIFTLTQAR